MKFIAQGDPVEYDVKQPGDACRLYRQDMAKALIGISTQNTDYERAQQAFRERDALRAALHALLSSHENYASEHKPEAEWDDYDMMMFPRWRAARALLTDRGATT